MGRPGEDAQKPCQRKTSQSFEPANGASASSRKNPVFDVEKSKAMSQDAELVKGIP
jgi:hypothetical protein